VLALAILKKFGIQLKNIRIKAWWHMSKKQRKKQVQQRHENTQALRREEAELWISEYKGKSIVIDYIEKFKVGLITAIKELRALGFNLPEEEIQTLIAEENAKNDLLTNQVILEQLLCDATQGIECGQENLEWDEKELIGKIIPESMKTNYLEKRAIYTAVLEDAQNVVNDIMAKLEIDDPKPDIAEFVSMLKEKLSCIEDAKESFNVASRYGWADYDDSGYGWLDDDSH
jgi:Ca2+-binding EF-hand superfamily protein